MIPRIQRFPFDWEEVPEIEEVSTGNLRATAMSGPLPGFVEQWTFTGSDCNRANTQLITVIPLNKCVPDTMGLTRSPYFIAAWYDDAGVRKMRTQGYSKSNCSPKPKTPAKLTMAPPSICMASSSGTSSRFVYKKARTNHPNTFTYRTYATKKCDGSFVESLYGDICFSGSGNGTSAAKYDCEAGGYMSYATGDCSGPATLMMPVGPLNAATGCSASRSNKGTTYNAYGCTSRGPVAVAAASSQFAAAEAVESD